MAVPQEPLECTDAAHKLKLLRAAVASIVLDLSTAQVFALAVREVAGRAEFAVLLAGAP